MNARSAGERGGGGEAAAAPLAERGRRSGRGGERLVSLGAGAGAVVARMGEWEGGGVSVEVEDDESEVEVGCWQGGMKSWRE